MPRQAASGSSLPRGSVLAAAALKLRISWGQAFDFDRRTCVGYVCRFPMFMQHDASRVYCAAMSRQRAAQSLQQALNAVALAPGSIAASTSTHACACTCSSISGAGPDAVRHMASAASKQRRQPMQHQQAPARSPSLTPPPLPRVLKHVTKQEMLHATAMPALDPLGPMQAITSSSNPALAPDASSNPSADSLAGASDQDIWEQVQLQSSSDARRMELLRLLRQYNYSLPGLQGQAVQATVLRVTQDSVLVDPGFYGVAEVPRSEVTLAALVTPVTAAPSSAAAAGSAAAAAPTGASQQPSSSTSPSSSPSTSAPSASAGAAASDGTGPSAAAAAAALAGREGLTDIRPGDVVALRVEALFTPFGDMALAAAETDADTRRAAAWRELSDAKASRRPVLGRVLNACTGGYAVGVGGLVALLPYGRFTLETVSAVGVLQEFLVEVVDQQRGLLAVADVRKGASRRLA